MINYQLFAELKAAIEEKYSSMHEMYSEESPKTYRNHLIWDNYGIRVVATNFTIAVLCEYDQNNPVAGVYIGVKVLDADKDASLLSQHLMNLNPNGKIRHIENGAHNRLFSWAYWERVSEVKDGLEMFDKLLNDCNDFLSQKIF